MNRAATNEIVIFSTADWATPYWTNKQHIARRLAKRGWSVLYVETVGLRAPGLGRTDGRLLRRLGAAVALAASSCRSALGRLAPDASHGPSLCRRPRIQRPGAFIRPSKPWLTKLRVPQGRHLDLPSFMPRWRHRIDRAALVYHCVSTSWRLSSRYRREAMGDRGSGRSYLWRIWS